MNNRERYNSRKYSSLLRSVFIVIGLFSCFNLAFSLEDERLVRSLNTAFMRQSKTDLERVLEQTQTTPLYSDVETYTISKIREALIFNRLEYAQFASLSLININLNNFEALDLYTRIGNALEARQAQQKQEDAERLARLEEEQQQAASIRPKLEEEFEQRVSAEGQNVYFDLSEHVRFSPFNWGVNANLLSLLLRSKSDSTDLLYGLGISGDFFYNSSAITVGAELNLSSHIITFLGEENFITDFNIVPAIAFSDLSDNLFLRIGFRGIIVDSPGDDSFDSTFLSPSVGLEWKKIDIGTTQSRVYLDYLIGQLVASNVESALDLGLRTIVPVSDQGNFTINTVFEVSNTLMIVSSGIENNSKITIGIGVGNYE